MIHEESKNVEQQINHRIIAEKKLINVTLVLAHQFIFNCFLNSPKGFDFISFPREFHTFGP